ncbi:MAG: hypothetical protein WCP68_15735, partial [Enhydrobacter sp.]
MNTHEIAALADKLVAGRKSKKPMDVAGLMADLSEADAYKVQFAVHDRFTAEGDPIVGWKVALTLPVQYEPLKLSGPVFAGIYKSGLRQSGAVFEAGYPLKPGIEPELVARIAKDAPAGGAPYTADGIRAYISNLYCGMELVDNRYADVTKMGGPARVADNVLQAALVTGTEIKDWQKRAMARGLKKKVKDIEATFKAVDMDNSGYISHQEFYQLLRKLGILKYAAIVPGGL